MSNDPDLLDVPCPECDGDGCWPEVLDDDGTPLIWVDCSHCGGNGVVIP